MDPHTVNPLLTTKIVGSYLRHHTVAATELPDIITSVHRALSEVGRPTPSVELPIPAVSVRQSVRPDCVVCLDCGYRGKTLRRHIASRHGLSRAEYLKRWGLKPDHPLTAPAYSEHRSTVAKQLGLGRKPQADMAGPSTSAEIAVASGDEEADADHAGPRRAVASGSDEQLHNLRGRGRRGPVLGLLRRNLSHSRRQLRRLNPEPSRASINSWLTILHYSKTACILTS